jgi:hypothetical protein
MVCDAANRDIAKRKMSSNFKQFAGADAGNDAFN